MKKLISISIVACLLASCGVFERRNSSDTAVQVAGVSLTQTQLDEVTRNAETPADSARIADEYIRQWAEDVLLYSKATRHENPDIEALVEDYRRQLYLHQYEERLLQKEMDQDVPDDSIKAYYEANREMFVLGNNIIKGILLIIPNGAPDLQKLRTWLQKPDANLEHIEKYAYQYATGYELFLDQWRSGTQVRLRMPVAQQDFSALLRSQKQIELQDSAQTYILEVTDKRMEGEPMPIDFAEKDIRNIIIAKRETAFLQQHKEDLYNEADRTFRIHRYKVEK